MGHTVSSSHKKMIILKKKKDDYIKTIDLESVEYFAKHII